MNQYFWNSVLLGCRYFFVPPAAEEQNLLNLPNKSMLIKFSTAVFAFYMESAVHLVPLGHTTHCSNTHLSPVTNELFYPWACICSGKKDIIYELLVEASSYSHTRGHIQFFFPHEFFKMKRQEKKMDADVNSHVFTCARAQKCAHTP